MSGRHANPSRGRRSTRDAERSAGDHALADWTGGMPVFVPQGYEPGYDYPLLVWVADPLGPAVELARVMPRLSLRNYVAVRATGGATAVWQAVDRVASRLSIHPRRIWLVGHAAAGTEAFRIACRHPEAHSPAWCRSAGRFHTPKDCSPGSPRCAGCRCSSAVGVRMVSTRPARSTRRSARFMRPAPCSACGSTRDRATFRRPFSATSIAG